MLIFVDTILAKIRQIANFTKLLIIEYILPLSNPSTLPSVILGHTPTVQDPGEEDGGVDRVCSSEWRDAEVLSHCSPPHFTQHLYCSKSHQVIQYMDVMHS